MKVCKMCGKELLPEVKHNTRYCPECKKIAKQINNAKFKGKRITVCEMCGKAFLKTGKSDKYCSDKCRRDVLKDPFKRKDPAEHRPKLTIEQLAVMAVESGTSYGKLVGRMQNNV